MVREDTSGELSRKQLSMPSPTDEIVIGRVTRAELAAWVIIAAGLVLIFVRDLVSMLAAGMLFYMLLRTMSRLLSGRIAKSAVRPVSILAAATVAIATVAGIVAIVIGIARVQLRNIPALMSRMAEILESTRLIILRLAGMDVLSSAAIQDAEDMKVFIAEWLKSNRDSISMAGGTLTIVAAHMFFGVLLAVMVFLRRIRRPDEPPTGPLGGHLASKVRSFYTAFSQVVGAQALISGINTTLTALYILVGIPAFTGESLAFSYTIIFITFVAGLIPIVGNLISNTVIVVVALGVSSGLAIASLVFLITIHKLEYVINSKIVGTRTNSQVWEILLALIVGEALFGFPGMAMGPIVYTFVKRELDAKALI